MVKKSGLPMSENVRKQKPRATKGQLIADLRRVQQKLYGNSLSKVVSRNSYREHGRYSDGTWDFHFGTFTEFRSQAGIFLSRPQKRLERDIAKHASVDHYRKLNRARKGWGKKYKRDNKSRFQLILGIADIHDEDVDPFWLRVVQETAKRCQPDIICIGGDLFDLPEFGKYTVDPREWNVTQKIRFVHNQVLRPFREACPNAQMDLIEGNHEARLLKHLADATPAMRAVLADLHGWDIASLLQLNQFEINYIAEADLTAWTKSDLNREIAKNYRVYYDCVLAHHYSYGRNQGMAGFSGHNHKHEMWTGHSPLLGTYEWHQIGCGHKRHACFTDGLQWSCGFVLIHVDTKTKLTNFEYIPITDFAVVGGEYYYRQPDEVVVPGRK